MARPIKRVRAEPDVVKELQRRSRSATIGVRDRERAAIVLLRLEVVGVEDVAEQLKTTPKRVSVWARRFEISGLDGLGDKPGRGRKASIPAAKVARVVTEATRPPKGRRRWSIRTMSRHVGFVRLGVQKPGPLDLARFIDQNAQCLAGTVQAMIEQGRKGRFERMMVYALCHRVHSYVGDQNGPKKSPLDAPRWAVAADRLSYGPAQTGSQFTEGTLHQPKAAAA
jgi:hypothetical protein